jgi:hypothetical protein
MKNIHLIPTEKPSRLHFDDKLFLSTNPQISKDINSIVEGRNIYITSDEEIKEGDWVITPTNDILEWAKAFQPIGKKIILTTDQKLIKYGVQPIDDGFLEWFVENPGCEKIEVIYSSLMKDYEYELLFPKETPQEEEQLPTKWFKTEQIETWIGESITTEGKEIKEIKGGRGKLIVMHQCGDNKEELISQLETMIYGLKEGFEYFIGN